MAFRVTELAVADLGAAAEYLRSRSSSETASAFEISVFDAFETIETTPNIGSPHWGVTLGIPGLRHLTLRRFHYLIMYQVTTDHTTVLRVLHAKQDISSFFH